jgi:hypothetical protein
MAKTVDTMTFFIGACKLVLKFPVHFLACHIAIPSSFATRAFHELARSVLATTVLAVSSAAAGMQSGHCCSIF